MHGQRRYFSCGELGVEEEELERGQRFNNHYEETKYRAEVAVRAAMARGMPGTVYRPAVVVGDSITGETQKYDDEVVHWLASGAGLEVVSSFADSDDHYKNYLFRKPKEG